MEIPPFPTRADDAHKGDVGRIVVIGGRLDELGMIGAPALTANAAFRCGAGLVQILTPQSAMAAVGVLAPCATTRVMGKGDETRLAAIAGDFSADVVAIGPGLCPSVRGEHVLALMESFEGPIVVDADALNALATIGAWKAPREGQVVVTPHPGEMRRLLEGLGVGDQNLSRSETAERFAGRTGCVTVLKGAGTVVADSGQSYVNRTGHSGMATAGAGDVLTGVIAALRGQGMQPFAASVLGVHLHGLAGELAARRIAQASITATDIVDALGEAVLSHAGCS